MKTHHLACTNWLYNSCTRRVSMMMGNWSPSLGNLFAIHNSSICVIKASYRYDIIKPAFVEQIKIACATLRASDAIQFATDFIVPCSSQFASTFNHEVIHISIIWCLFSIANEENVVRCIGSRLSMISCC
uniref:Uncharacterized protein n=1 Tax=Spongospora subterranea TaxID=70186 RepID=A0A0H5QSY4_9EUKA|eukprot:CRZ05065.1 hypothetical protein [Spongospora subterranea]